MDFEADVKSEILQNLSYDRSDTATVSALNGMKMGDLLNIFINWLSRHVHPHPRNIFLSSELKSNPDFQKNIAQINKIIDKIKNGGDISPHLSRRVLTGYSLPQKTKKLHNRKDLDMLLNDWGIHHLHISDVIDSDGFVIRGDLLLFVIFLDDNAFLLDLATHKSWMNTHLVEVAVNNWPQQELFYELKGISPPTTAITDADRKKMRNVGVNVFIEVNSKLYTSAKTVGLSCAGTSSRATMEVIRFKRQLTQARAQIEKDPEYLRPYLENTGKKWPKNPDFHLKFVTSQKGFHFVFHEITTGALFGFWPFFNL